MKKSIRILACILAFSLAIPLFACDNKDDKPTVNSEKETATQAGEESKADETDTEKSTTEATTEAIETTEEETVEETETNLILGDEIEYADDFSVSKVFTDNMVLQRNEYIRVWGWADESENGKKISAEFLGLKADALIENGEWEIIFRQKLEANTDLGNSLMLYANDVSASFDNVLVGDVFMVIGQSNIQYSVNEYLHSNPDPDWTLDDFNNDALIRYIYNSNTDTQGYPTRGTTDVCPDLISGNVWEIPSKSNIARFSALGYFFANDIIERTNNEIPVGIIQMSASGRPLCTFMPNELADKYQSDFLDSDGIYKGNHHKDNAIARYMYNHYMYAYEKMPLAGIVWNQGEAESPEDLSTVYVERFTALMTYMRDKHNLVNKEFPVFVVEFPTTYSKPAGYEGDWNQYLDTGRIRATMGMIPDSLSNSYIAVCSDLWDDETHVNNIHPYCKFEQAARVADLAQAVMYGGKTLDEATGPILVSVEKSADNTVFTLKFTNYGEGLTTADGSTIVNGIVAISKKNTIYTNCNVTAEITAVDTITVTTSKASAGIAYNCITGNFYGDEINLCDSFGNPAKAFWYFAP